MLTNLGTALPAFAEESQATPETATSDSAETEETAESAPALAQITDNLYADLPDAPDRQLPGQHGPTCGNRRDENQHFGMDH